MGNAGTLVFGADGTFDNAASTIADLGVTITWANGASDTIGAAAINMAKAVQYGQASFVRAISQDGTAQGSLRGIRIGADGVVTAQYSNSQFKAIDTWHLRRFPMSTTWSAWAAHCRADTEFRCGNGRRAGASGRGNLLPGSLELDGGLGRSICHVAHFPTQFSGELESDHHGGRDVFRGGGLEEIIHS